MSADESTDQKVTNAILKTEIQHLREEVTRGFTAVTMRQDKQNGTMDSLRACDNDHEARLKLLENFMEKDLRPALIEIKGIRVDLVKNVSIIGAIGTIIAATFVAAKLFGLF